MTEETTTQEAPAAETKPAPTPRVSLIMTHGSEQIKLLKYPFPTKASRFPVKVNGVEVQAACTAGRGKAYTYFLINNTSFYVPGVIPPDAELSVNFPEDYKFDDAQAVRVSTYKPKKAKKVEGEASAEGESTEPAADADTEANVPAQTGEKAARRKK